jgi:type VI secretion system secreted protein Hcp
MAQFDAFLKLDGVKGESQDDKHKNEIDILSWSWNLTNTGTGHVGGGGGAGKVKVGDLHITKRADSASPILFKNCATGTHIKSGILVVRKAGGTALEYLKLELTQILVSSITASTDEELPMLTEEVELNFATFKIHYTPQDEKGAGGATVDFSWDIAKNKAA